MLPTILNQIAINASIITAAILSVHRFLSDFQTGQLGIKLREHGHELGSSAGHSRKELPKQDPSGLGPQSQSDHRSLFDGFWTHQILHTEGNGSLAPGESDGHLDAHLRVAGVYTKFKLRICEAACFLTQRRGGS